MKENQNKTREVQVMEGNQNEPAEGLQDSSQRKSEKLRKRIIFTLMVIVFLGCMYLLFGPSKDDKKAKNIGLNEVVPQATNVGLQADKQKAYEQDMLEQKEQEKKKGFLSLSDYWNGEKASGKDTTASENRYNEDDGYVQSPGKSNPALSSYRTMQSTLGSFYEQDDLETQQLRKEVEELKEQLAEKEAQPPTNNVDNQLELMEKSYQMAAKYLPTNAKPVEPVKIDTGSPVGTAAKKSFVSFATIRKDAVSALYREDADSAFMAKWGEERNRGFYTVGAAKQVIQPKNSIRACVQEAQTVTDETGVRLRLLEKAQVPNRSIPPGTMLTASAKFQSGRLQLEVTSIELDGNIIPIDLTVYDLDGQQGLNVPYSQEMNALTEMASNMSQSTGTSIMMTRSAGQQVAGNLSRGVIQGLSGYFSKKIQTPKVRLKAGHQLFLVSKK